MGQIVRYIMKFMQLAVLALLQAMACQAASEPRVDALAASGRRRLCRALSESQRGKIGELFTKMIHQGNLFAGWSVAYRAFVGPEGPASGQFSAVWMYGKLSEEDKREVDALEASSRRRLCPKLSERQRNMIGELFVKMNRQRNLQEAGWDICHYHKPFVGPNKVAGSDWQQFSA